jgi:hypothetical protein
MEAAVGDRIRKERPREAGLIELFGEEGEQLTLVYAAQGPPSYPSSSHLYLRACLFGRVGVAGEGIVAKGLGSGGGGLIGGYERVWHGAVMLSPSA